MSDIAAQRTGCVDPVHGDRAAVSQDVGLDIPALSSKPLTVCRQDVDPHPTSARTVRFECREVHSIHPCMCPHVTSVFFTTCGSLSPSNAVPLVLSSCPPGSPGNPFPSQVFTVGIPALLPPASQLSHPGILQVIWPFLGAHEGSIAFLIRKR